jgi:hypothetical protein
LKGWDVVIDSQEIAVSAIKEIYDLWKVDSDRTQWVGDTSSEVILREGYGFDWWPGDFKVRVRIYGPHPELDKPIYRLSVQTDFLCDVDVTTQKFKENLSLLNRFSPTFAICTHPTAMSQIAEKYGHEKFDLDLKSWKVWLASTVYLHEGIKGWLPRFFASLAVLQPIESQFRAKLAMPLLGGNLDCSGPPGRRDSEKTLDDILNVEGSVFAPDGVQQSKWIGTGEFEEIIDKWGRCDTGFGFADNKGLTIETPFGDHTAILLLKTDAPHPRLGNGLLAILKIPLLSKPESANEFCIELNYAEAQLWKGSAFIGNWCANEGRVEGETDSAFGPAFSAFIPNFVYRPGIAENLVLYAINRAQWVRRIWLPDAIDLPMHEILSKRLNPH